MDKIFPDETGPGSHYTPPCLKAASYKDGWYTNKDGKRALCVTNPRELNPIATPRAGSQQSLDSEHDAGEDGTWYIQSGYTIYYSVQFCKQRCIQKKTSCCTESTPGFSNGRCCDDGAQAYTYDITYAPRGFVRASAQSNICQKDQLNLPCDLPKCDAPCEWEWTEWVGECDCECGTKVKTRRTRLTKGAVGVGGICKQPMYDDETKKYWPSEFAFTKDCPLKELMGL